MDTSHSTKLKEALKKVATYRDGLGLKVDPGIKKTVALINLLGFKTYQSCAGHLRLDHGLLTPWVDVIVPNKKSEEKLRTIVRSYWQDSESWERPSITGLFIDDFALKSSKHLRLICGPFIISNVKKDKARMPETVRTWFYKEGTKEMHLFTKYLQDVFEAKKKPSKKAPKGRYTD